jgi:D-alanyl-D-alanine dipeptidase
MSRSTLISVLVIAVVLAICFGAAALTILREYRTVAREVQELKAALAAEDSGTIVRDMEAVKARLQEENLALASRLSRAAQGFVLIEEADPSIIIDLRYATPDNFTGQQVYPRAVAILRPETAAKLAAANAEFRELGYTLKVWDAYRPAWAERELWHATAEKAYVADPRYPSRHNRGTTVDVTLVDEEGNELEMPTPFDEFSERAGRSYQGMTAAAKANMDLLTEVMVRNGFSTIGNEWWHFDDAQWRDYPAVDISFELFITE